MLWSTDRPVGADPSLIVERFSKRFMATASSNRKCGLRGERRR
jgi:hypothetical protein